MAGAQVELDLVGVTPEEECHQYSSLWGADVLYFIYYSLRGTVLHPDTALGCWAGWC